MKEAILGIILIFGLAVGIALLMALPVMLLWNALIPAIFGLTTISFWQALGLSLLCSLLFKSYSSSSD